MKNESERKEKKLRESEEKHKLILENVNDLITIINEKFEYEYINEKAYFDLLGYTIEDIIGKTLISPLHPDDVKNTLKNLKKVFKTGMGRKEYRLRHKNGHYLWLEHKGKTFIDIDGKRKVLIISRDITERKKAENIILEENRKLMEISQIKNELVMRASHEFKTPLSSIYAASQLLLKDFREKFDSKAFELIEIIYRGSQKLRQLIENLLDLSRVESGKLKLSLREENLIYLIHNCCDGLKYWADKRNINIKIELPSEITVKIDKLRIEQVLINLLSNAIKYTPPKGNIYISLNVNNQWVEISIRDTGVGLTNEEKQLLFQKFGRISRVLEDLDLETEGSGLGLYISKEIVELHNGKILVESEGRSKGSTFTLRLPRSK